MSFFVELEAEPNAVVFEQGRFRVKEQIGLGKEAFSMANLGRFLEFLGAPTMTMGNQTMVGRHGGFNMHGQIRLQAGAALVHGCTLVKLVTWKTPCSPLP